MTKPKEYDILYKLGKLDSNNKIIKEYILTQEDLDDVTILMAGKGLTIEIAYLFAVDQSEQQHSNTTE